MLRRIRNERNCGLVWFSFADLITIRWIEGSVWNEVYCSSFELLFLFLSQEWKRILPAGILSMILNLLADELYPHPMRVYNTRNLITTVVSDTVPQYGTPEQYCYIFYNTVVYILSSWRVFWILYEVQYGTVGKNTLEFSQPRPRIFFGKPITLERFQNPQDGSAVSLGISTLETCCRRVDLVQN